MVSKTNRHNTTTLALFSLYRGVPSPYVCQISEVVFLMCLPHMSGLHCFEKTNNPPTILLYKKKHIKTQHYTLFSPFNLVVCYAERILHKRERSSLGFPLLHSGLKWQIHWINDTWPLTYWLWPFKTSFLLCEPPPSSPVFLIWRRVNKHLRVSVKYLSILTLRPFVSCKTS